MNIKTPNKTARQAKSFTERAKIAMLRRGLTTKDLAAIIERSREATSKTINGNTDRFPLVRQKIKGVLGV